MKTMAFFLEEEHSAFLESLRIRDRKQNKWNTFLSKPFRTFPVPEGRQTIARQFIAGVESRGPQSPVGTTEGNGAATVLSSLPGLGDKPDRDPGNELPGYCLSSPWDSPAKKAGFLIFPNLIFIPRFCMETLFSHLITLVARRLHLSNNLITLFLQGQVVGVGKRYFANKRNRG